MPTKDPHIALIDAHEELQNIKLWVKAANDLVRQKYMAGDKLADEDRVMLAHIRQKAVDATRRIQDKLYEELESHGRCTPS